MSDNSEMFFQTQPAGEMVPQTCEDCGGTSFLLFGETRDDKIDAFHSKCASCGKRGCLVVEIEMVATPKFQQFADAPDECLSVVTSSAGLPSETVTLKPPAGE